MNIPELIENPADLDEWVANRTETFNALLVAFAGAAEGEQWSDCMSVAGMIGSHHAVVNSDLVAIVDRHMSAS